MSIFTNGNGIALSNAKVLEATMLVKMRDSARIGELPSGYTVLGESLLHFGTSSSNGSIDAKGYFHAGSKSPGGEAVAILSADGRISISFAGTNDNLDYASIFKFGNNSYIDGFNAYLTAVANFAKANGYTIDIVCGKSLGGAATNILRDRPDIAGGAYVNATYFAVASPAIADSKNIYNFGYDNDFAFEAYEKYFGSGDGDHASATDHIILFNDQYASSTWTQLNEMSAHSYSNFERGIKALTGTVFSNEITQDSFVIISNRKDVDMNLALTRTGVIPNMVYFISPDIREDNVTGSKYNDRMDLGEWNDIARGNLGDDIIYGGNGADTLYGGEGADTLFGGNWNDKLYGENGNDTIKGGEGIDLIYGGNANDLIYGGNGVDTIYGDAGLDTVYGDGGNDIVYLGIDNDIYFDGAKSSGNDVIYGGDGNDIFNGVDGNDKFFGDAGDDVIKAGSGADRLSGGLGSDTLTGGLGRDTFVFNGQGHDKITDFNASQDYLDFEGTVSAWTPATLAANCVDTSAGLLIHIDAKNDILLVGFHTTNYASILIV